MKERFKEIRLDTGLNQAEFGKRLGVGNTAISKIEKGESNLTEQMIVAVCREFGISENWLRTGAGEMRIATKDALIQQMADAYNLDTLDVAYIEGYLNLPEAQKAAIKTHLLNVARSYSASETDTNLADGIAAHAESVNEAARVEFSRELTIDEKTELYRQRLIAEKRESPKSTTYGNPATGSRQSGAV